MCGILSVLRYNDFSCAKIENIKENFAKHSERGPEQSTFIEENINEHIHLLGFHRLAINGFQQEDSMQPIYKKNCILICNGEIYNWKELAEKAGVECETGSDCEIIIDMYKKYGIEYTLQILDGVFAFVLIDKDDDTVMIARDPLGVRPLFIGNSLSNELFICSELKGIHDKCIYVKQFKIR